MENTEQVVDTSVTETNLNAPETTTATPDPVSASPASTTTPDPAIVAAAPAAPAFTPNFKFKVMDKEHEIPEFLRGVVKDVDTQKKLIELHEKAYGLDAVKGKYQSTKQQFESLMSEKKAQDAGLATLGQYLEKNDLDSFFKALKISEEQVLQYALDRVNYRELPIEKRMQHDAQLSERQRTYQLEQQYQQLQQQFQQESVQARTFQLDSALARPDVKTVADAFDAKVGKPGAFKAEVIKRGQYANFTTGADISADQAVSEVLGMFSPFVQQATQAPAQAATQSTSGAQSAPPVIPNVTGRGTSPVRKAVKSIADLEQRAREL